MRESTDPIESVSLFFPVYRDENTVKIVADKVVELLDSLDCEYEAIVADGASPDSSGEIADKLAVDHEHVRLIHHETNRGYGAAVKSGLAAAKDVEALGLYSVLEGHWASPVLVWRQERRRNAPLTLLCLRSEVSTPFRQSSR